MERPGSCPPGQASPITMGESRMPFEHPLHLNASTLRLVTGQAWKRVSERIQAPFGACSGSNV